MRRFLEGRHSKVGLAPGTPVHIGRIKTEATQISILDYNETECKNIMTSSVEDCLHYKHTDTITWFNINGINATEIINKLGEGFGLHPLICEDIVNTDHRPKIEEYDDYIYTVIKVIDFDEEKEEFQTEQVSLVLKNNILLTFQEKQSKLFDPIRERILNNKGRVRKMRADYLYYCLLDIIIDNYFVFLEKIGDKIEEIEDVLLVNPNSATVQTIHSLKREMIYVRKSIWPLREIISYLQRLDSPLISDTIGPYLRDIYDHTIQVVDAIESYRDMISGMLDIYLSSVSNRMNEVMKVLTIISTIFIPLTFLAGVYGMNFKNMPELSSPVGYPILWGIMILIAVIMLIFFKRKKWL